MAHNTETNLQNAMLLHVGKIPGLTLFHNVIGTFKTQWGGFVKTGLSPGSSDLIGYKIIEITPEMVGTHVAQFVAIEVKTHRKGSKESEKQIAFRTRVMSRGGFAAVARSVEEFLNLFNKKTTYNHVFEKLAEKQEPLEHEFEQVLDANAWDLMISK